jgi:hypothetical protein
MPKYRINPNDITEEGVAVDKITEVGKVKHGAYFRIVVELEEDTEINPLLMEEAYKLVLALNIGSKMLETLDNK